MNDSEIQSIQTEIIPPSAIESIARAEIDQQISTAKRYPRVLSKVKADMLSFATLDQETAESCFYSLPRGGKNIQGPSVRLAEIAVSCYGNLRAGSRIMEAVTSGDSPHVMIQAFAMDLEKNTAITIEKRRRIVGKKSKGGVIDEDDINLASNAGSAIAFRDAVFKVVPLALIKPVYEAAKQVAIGDAKTLGDRRARALASFAKMGIDEKRVLQSLGKPKIDDIDLNDLETLFGLHTAIKDGATSIDEAFPKIIGSGTVGTPVGDAAKTAEKPKEEAPAEKEPAKPEPSEPKGAPTIEELREQVKASLGKVNKGTKELVAVLCRKGMLKDACVFGEIPQSVLQGVVDGWDDIAEALAGKA